MDSDAPNLYEPFPRPLEEYDHDLTELIRWTANNQPDINEARQILKEWEATPRKALCPCGSNKKYKNCHASIKLVV